MSEPGLIGKLGIALSERRWRRAARPLHMLEAYLNPNYKTQFYLASDLFMTNQRNGKVPAPVLDKILAGLRTSISENPDYPYAHTVYASLCIQRAKILLASEAIEKDRYTRTRELLRQARESAQSAVKLDRRLRYHSYSELDEIEELEASIPQER